MKKSSLYAGMSEVKAAADAIRSNYLSIDALRFTGAVEFGSRALDVPPTNYTDHDVAVTREMADKILETKDGYRVCCIDTYFNVVPKSEGNYLIRGLYSHGDSNEIDLLVLENQSDLDIVKKSVEDIKNLDKMFLQVKSNRIKAYQKALKKNGWKYKNIKTAIRLKLKGYP